MRLVNDSILAFDYTLPVYNWFYPAVHYDLPPDESRMPEVVKQNPINVFDVIAGGGTTTRGLYFHIPYCEDICAFCPFARTVPRDGETIERYLQALLREIEIKARYPSVSRLPVHAIFVGGGTPSILEPDQILRFGEAIHRHFDLSQLREFSFEMNVKSVTRAKLEAMRQIGVTHGRNGVQTFNPRFRDLLSLSAPIEVVRDVVAQVKQMFPYSCIDLLYGFNGQTVDEFLGDLHHAASLGTKLIDLYPVNNYVTQVRLHRRFAEAGLPTTSGLTKFAYNLIGREYMRGRGYLPHNGHGYCQVAPTEAARDPVTTRTYRFEYHECVYGYSDCDFIGFGSCAESMMPGVALVNEADSRRYTNQLLDGDSVPMAVYPHDPALDVFRGLILHLPYHGYADKARAHVTTAPPETQQALERCIERGLVVDAGEEYRLTRDGWRWYVDLLYYLLPSCEKGTIDAAIAERAGQADRHVEESAISFLQSAT